MSRLSEQFEGDFRPSFHLAPPLFAQIGSDGRPKKITFGPWLLPVLKVLAKTRRLRGSWLDPFRFNPEKAVDRKMLADYETDLDLIAHSHGNIKDFLTLASWPEQVRGFGFIRTNAAALAAKTREKARSALLT
jgi:indolepyruvate ferredoxin oxidoreductase